MSAVRWQAEAQRACRDVLGPLLARQGFSGAFPSWHRLGADCVECVTVSVFVRGGVQVTLGSTAWRARLETRSPRSDGLKCVRTAPLRGFLSIDSRAHLAALPGALAGVAKALATEGRAFWRAHHADLARRALVEALEAAISHERVSPDGERVGERGEPRPSAVARVRDLLAGVPKKGAQEALDLVRLRDWPRLERLPRLLPLVDVLCAWRPPWLLGAALVTAAVLDGGARKAKVLAWVRPWLRRVSSLGPQLAMFTDHLVAAKRVEAAAQVFELIIGRCALDAPYFGNALWCVLAGNGAVADRDRAARLLRAAVRVRPDDPSVRFNAACLELERGRLREAEAHLVAALEAGADRDLVRAERRLQPLLAAPGVLKALRLTRRPTRRAGFITHAEPTAR